MSKWNGSATLVKTVDSNYESGLKWLKWSSMLLVFVLKQQNILNDILIWYEINCFDKKNIKVVTSVLKYVSNVLQNLKI